MSAGLAASTVTPGNTAPVVSRTTPAIAPVVDGCAGAADGTSKATISDTPYIKRLMLLLPLGDVAFESREPLLFPCCCTCRQCATPKKSTPFLLLLLLLLHAHRRAVYT